MDEDPNTTPMPTPRQKKEQLVNACPKDFRIAYDLREGEFTEPFAEVGKIWKIILIVSENQVQARATANRLTTAWPVAVPQTKMIALTTERRRNTNPKKHKNKKSKYSKKKNKKPEKTPKKPAEQRRTTQS